VLRDWLPFYEKHFGAVGERTREAVMAISPAQVDQVLASKKSGHGVVNRRTPKANAALKALVPIRAQCWNAKEPGWLEADTVAHCGGDMGGSFLWSLTATDIFSGWTEVRTSWNRGQHGVCGAFAELEEGLPFAILGVDTDNGGESKRSGDSQPKAARRANAVRQFLNYHLHRHFTGREKPVEMTRSRPYHKNDQAHVEQKNSIHVRQLLGFERLGHDLLMAPVFELLKAWSVWRNCFTTTFKQIEKRRVGSKTVRTHETVPKTPCERLIAYCGEVGDQATAEALWAWRALHDPFELKAWIEKRLTMIWKLDAALTLAQNRKHDPSFYSELTIKPPTPQDTTNSPKAA
jgi:hypothetical protein